ncbi:hypothetical protein QO588_003615 [Salmonella enterica]|uniref:Uncharacterized protein n=1 Tax=Citrobacter meridianamericanus TaxID=2894201 RepID=A0ABT1BEX3_9ENTR|nr:hypothetical protein [Citrobacter meridianamericanus]EBP9818073.1 hypothetical protein [Salmonella enterica]EGZ4032501.1 hypothetical protein [Salmonella enterica subsp. enterica serovar Javiana]HCX7090125.1 hypothetical protein [Salmonella enterica subsp. enterica]ECE1413805.1 hypothetical protein [Salmonella enterica]ELS7235294.1 hypothetical protein [Salmonella enterica]
MSGLYRISAVLLFSVCIMPAHAEIFSEAHKLGAFSGAMRFCENKYETHEGRYKWARLRVALEVSEMSGKDKTKALLASDNARRKGTYLGNRLSRGECEALLKLGEWKRFSR